MITGWNQVAENEFVEYWISVMKKFDDYSPFVQGELRQVAYDAYMHARSDRSSQ